MRVTAGTKLYGSGPSPINSPAFDDSSGILTPVGLAVGLANKLQTLNVKKYICFLINTSFCC